MKLSIIVTTRNRREDLLACIESIKNSNFEGIGWELIVVDDFSNDETQFLSANDIGIKNAIIIHNKKQHMMVQSRNIGAMKSRGDYLLFVDDDNILAADMISILLEFADAHPEYGIIGPTMYFYNTRKPYLDFQTISFYTGKTTAHIDEKNREICESDGVPNVFLIRREVINLCGYFDGDILQTYSEPVYAFAAKQYGYKSCIVKKAKTYHKVTEHDKWSPRALGGQFKQKAYCLMRNRIVIVARYGKWYHIAVFMTFFSWMWPLVYSLVILRHGRFDLIRLYWQGFLDGFRYVITGNLHDTISKQ